MEYKTGDDERPLTTEERNLAKWLLEHGNEKASSFLRDLDKAKVYSKCPCGCASVDFCEKSQNHSNQGLTILSDYLWKNSEGKLFGIFIFEYGNTLGGLEVYALEADGPPNYLPKIEALFPWEDGMKK